MHVDFRPVIDFGRFMIQEFGEVESGKSRFQLNIYTITMVMRQLDGAQIGSGTMFKKEASKGYLVFILCVLHLVYVFDFNLFQHCTPYERVLEI
jgi:hypothetical protein